MAKSPLVKTPHPLDAPHIISGWVRLVLAILSPPLLFIWALAMAGMADHFRSASIFGFSGTILFILFFGAFEWGLWTVRISTGSWLAIGFWGYSTALNSICSLSAMVLVATFLLPSGPFRHTSYLSGEEKTLFILMLVYSGVFAMASIYFLTHELRVRQVDALENAEIGLNPPTDFR